MGVVHFCAPNVPALVARTSSHALTNALLPYLVMVARLGLEAALRRSRTLRQGLYLYRGVLSNRLVQPDLVSADLETVVHGLD
jgi:alanine dehydrogenase